MMTDWHESNTMAFGLSPWAGKENPRSSEKVGRTPMISSWSPFKSCTEAVS